jgi:indolepyruvate ferredoxin oxidoreductase beta subunit
MKPICVLVTALGGEGGGVLAEWLVETAVRSGYCAQSTSIPGVAQRTGATTYYVEVFPIASAELDGRTPVFSLHPVAGGLDLLASSELLETVRQIGNGMATHERTHVLSSTSRSLTTAEKMVPGDGRATNAELLAIVRAHAREVQAFDMAQLAHANGTVISAVLFGAIAASGVLPLPRAACEATIRASDKGAEASLRGFAAAFAAVTALRTERAVVDAAIASAVANIADPAGAGAASAPISPALAAFPADVREIADLGHTRLVDYQDARYAALYLARLERILAAERAGAADANAHPTTRAAARWLALWMAFDDIVRVADLKTRASRFARVRREVKAEGDDVIRMVDHFKPGVAELASLLPHRLADALVRHDRTRQARGQEPLAWPLKIRTDTVFGFLLLRLLAAMKPLRRSGSRFALEQSAIERWLDGVERAARRHAALGLELAECGRLIKGYGATNERGKENLLHVLDHLAIAASFASDDERAAAIRAAREAALADGSGQALDKALSAHGAAPRPVPAQPIRWVARRPGKAAAARAHASEPAP